MAQGIAATDPTVRRAQRSQPTAGRTACGPYNTGAARNPQLGTRNPQPL